MSLYNPFGAFVEKTRLLVQRRLRDGTLAYLGNGAGKVEISDKPGYVYARYPGPKDVNGNATFSSPFAVRASGAAFLNYEGAAVYVAVGYNSELEIVSAHYAELDKTGIDTRVLNPLHQQSKWVYLWQLTIALCSAVGNSVTGSFLVTVKKFRHYTGNVFQTFETGLQADKIDLSSFVPATDMHGYAAVWIDTYGNVAEVVASTTQSLFTPLDATDIQECVDNAPGRPPDAVALKLFYLSNDQGTITQQAAKDVDVRQFLNMPFIWGFPTDLTTRERVRPGYTLVTGPYTPTGNGDLTVESGGRVIIKAVDNLTATTDPTVNDDANDGYTVDSVWVNTTTPAWFVLIDATPGAAVWVPLAGSSGMTSFDITDGSTTTTVSDGDVIDFEGGTGFGVTLAGLMLSFAIDDTVWATRAYVDQAILGLNAKADVRLATAAALATNIYANGSSGVGATLTGFATGVLTVDGVTVALNDRVLVKDEVSASHNGIYKCTVAGAIGVAYVLTRTTDGDTDAELRGGWMVVTEGTVNSTQAYVNTNVSAITFGATSITFGEFSAGVITAGDGLTKTGNSLAVNSTVVRTTGAQAVASKTIDTSDIGTTTPGAGYFSDLRVKAGSFLGRLTHAITVARTWTFPDKDITVAGIVDIPLNAMTSLTGDVTGTGPGATATTLATVNSTTGAMRGVQKVVTNPKGLITEIVEGANWMKPVRATLNPASDTLPSTTYANGSSGVGATLTKSTNGALITFDGVTLVVGDRVLLRTGAGAPGNSGGIYTVTDLGSAGTPWILTRATDSDEGADFVFQTVIVTSGTGLRGTIWQCTSATAIAIGSTPPGYIGGNSILYPRTAVLANQQTSGTAGGASSATTWNNLALNTELYDPDGIVTLSSNKMTPLPGTYLLFDASSYVAGGGSNIRNRLFNVTGAAAVQSGIGAGSLSAAGGLSQMIWIFTANGTDEYRIDMYTSVAKTTDGLGHAVSDGTAEIYNLVVLVKIA